MSVNVDPSTWRLRTTGGIPYKLYQGYPQGSFEAENAEATEQYIIRASDLPAFALESFPPMVVWNGTLSFRNKRACPGRPNLLTRRISYASLDDGLPVDPWGVDAAAPDKTYCQYLMVTIEYETGKAGEDDKPETFLEVSADAAAEFIMLPLRGDAYWGHPGGDGVTEMNLPSSQLVPETEWTVRWPQIPRTFLPTVINAMRGLLGKVNDFAMPLLNGAASQTILFVGYSLREQYTWRSGLEEEPPAEIEMKFLEKRVPTGDGFVGHNCFYRPDTGNYEPIWIGEGANAHTVYRGGDLNSMFPPVIGGMT